MSQKQTCFGLPLSNRALLTCGTSAKELIDMSVNDENTGEIDAIWVATVSSVRLECIPLLGAIRRHRE
jgi:hypothetical protein